VRLDAILAFFHRDPTDEGWLDDNV